MRRMDKYIAMGDVYQAVASTTIITIIQNKNYNYNYNYNNKEHNDVTKIPKELCSSLLTCGKMSGLDARRLFTNLDRKGTSLNARKPLI